MKCIIRSLFNLADEAIDALHNLFDFSDPADELWDWRGAERLAEAEAREEVFEPRSDWNRLWDWVDSVIDPPCAQSSDAVEADHTSHAASESPAAPPPPSPEGVAAAGHPTRRIETHDNIEFRYWGDELDEIVARNVRLHFECMDNGAWWMLIRTPDDREWHVNLGVKKDDAGPGDPKLVLPLQNYAFHELDD